MPTVFSPPVSLSDRLPLSRPRALTCAERKKERASIAGPKHLDHSTSNGPAQSAPKLSMNNEIT
jgi:hypothetical protein